jgi:bifunctional non-homologous end joining protein LigD
MSRTRLPPSGFIKPCLPSPAEHPPSGPGWIHEIKHDGFRLMARRDARRSKDWLKFKNPAAPAVKREAEEEWG